MTEAGDSARLPLSQVNVRMKIDESIEIDSIELWIPGESPATAMHTEYCGWTFRRAGAATYTTVNATQLEPHEGGSTLVRSCLRTGSVEISVG